MKKDLLAVAVAMALVVGVAGAAFAAGSNTLTVSAAVTGSCGFTSGTSTMNFGAIDPASGGGAQTATVNWWCTKGTTVTGFTVDNGLHFSGGNRRMESNGTAGEFLIYSLSYVSPVGLSGNGRSSSTALNIDGTVTAVNAGDAAALADYEDTVTIDILP